MDRIQAIAPTGKKLEALAATQGAVIATVPFHSVLARTLNQNSASHLVQSGENLTRIVQQHLAGRGQSYTNDELVNSVRQVAQANQLKNANLIMPGQTISLDTLGGNTRPAAAVMALPGSLPPAVKPVAVPAETGPPMDARMRMAMSAAAQPASATAITAATDPATLTGQGGGLADLAPLATKFNDLLPGVALQAQNTVNSVAGTLSRVRALLTPSPPEAAAKAEAWQSLVEQPVKLTSTFGMRADPFTGRPAFHHGIDLAAPKGSAIRPMAAGTVISSGWEPGYGKVVRVQHENGLETIYGHCSDSLVKAGDAVTKDTIIAKVGSTGRSTSDHLHFEAQKDGRPVNPMPLLGAL